MWDSQQLGGSEKRGGGNGVSLSSAMSDSHVSWHSRSGNPTHPLNMLRSLEVITTTHCTIFVLHRLLLCRTKHALAFALSLPDSGPQPDVDGGSHDENRRCF